jgi:hypothetical protein
MGVWRPRRPAWALLLLAVCIAFPARAQAPCGPKQRRVSLLLTGGVAVHWSPVESGTPAPGGLIAGLFCITRTWTFSPYYGGWFRSFDFQLIRLGLATGIVVRRLRLEVGGGVAKIYPGFIEYRGDPHRFTYASSNGWELTVRATHEFLVFREVALGGLIDVALQWIDAGKVVSLLVGPSLRWPAKR